MKTLTPKTHMLLTLVNADLPNGPRSALSEFIDNSLGDAAGDAKEVQIYYKKDALLILDNGNGVKDINALFTLGDSHSRLSSTDIGSFGYGSKVGALFLGYKVDVKTVYKNVFHHYSVDWEQVKNSGKWPDAYSGEGKSPSKAPSFIRNGGTQITISKRHSDRQWKLSSMGEKLGHTYTPALQAGRVIKLIEVDARGHSKVFPLQHSATSRKLKKVIEFTGHIDGKIFRVRAGIKHNQTKAMNAVHIAYGHRFITSVNKLPTSNLPFDFYCEVLLRDGWKESLTATKNDIAIDKVKLLNAVEIGVADLLKELESRSEEIRLDIMNAQLATALAEAIGAIRFDQSGQSQPGEVIQIRSPSSETDGQEDGNSPPSQPDIDGDDETSTEAKMPELGGSLGEDDLPSQSKSGGLQLKFEPLGNKFVHRISFDETGLMLTLNEDIPYVKDARDIPYNASAIWALTATALVDYIWELPDDRASLISGLAKTMKNSGGLEQEHKDRLYYTLLNKAPSIKEPTESHIKAVGETYE